MTKAALKLQPTNTRERLLEIAEHLFAQKGFSATSLRDVGRELDMPNASLLYHFPNKEKIYAAVLERAASSLAEAYDTAAGARGNTRTKLRVLASALMNWHLARPQHAQLVLRELLDNPERAARVRHWHFAGVIRKMVDLIETGQREGVFRPCDPPSFVLHMIGSISYFFAALPTSAGILKTSRKRLTDTYRKEALRNLEHALFVHEKNSRGD